MVIGSGEETPTNPVGDPRRPSADLHTRRFLNEPIREVEDFRGSALGGISGCGSQRDGSTGEAVPRDIKRD